MCTQALKMTKALSWNIGGVSEIEAGTKEPFLSNVNNVNNKTVTCTWKSCTLTCILQNGSTEQNAFKHMPQIQWLFITYTVHRTRRYYCVHTVHACMALLAKPLPPQILLSMIQQHPCPRKDSHMTKSQLTQLVSCVLYLLSNLLSNMYPCITHIYLSFVMLYM